MSGLLGKLWCWLDWHHWDSLTGWPWQAKCVRCGKREIDVWGPK